jgi:hypothetical protein
MLRKEARVKKDSWPAERPGHTRARCGGGLVPALDRPRRRCGAARDRRGVTARGRMAADRQRSPRRAGVAVSARIVGENAAAEEGAMQVRVAQGGIGRDSCLIQAADVVGGAGRR